MAFTPHWVHVSGRCRCSECGEMVDAAWKFFEQVALYTQTICDQCALTLVEEAAILGESTEEEQIS